MVLGTAAALAREDQIHVDVCERRGYYVPIGTLKRETFGR